MSCGCTSTSSYSPTTSSGYPQPRRVGSQPIVPVVQQWASQLRSAFEVELMGRDGEEVLTLDAPISGQVLYNADTRKAYVGNLSATYVADSYPCQTTPLSGMLIYAKDPGCRDLGSNPDRELMVVRPSTGSTGFLFGHEHSCPSGQGSTPELIPVEIEPTALPGTTPDNLYGLYYVRTTSTDSCVPSSYQWYKIAGLPPIDQTKLATTEMAASDLQDLTDGFNMAGWRLVNGKWVAYRITNQSLNILQKVLPQPSLVHQTPWYSIGSANPDLNPTQTLLTFNPVNLPGYKAEYGTMWLQTRLIVSSTGADYRIKIFAGAQEIHNGIVREVNGIAGDFINPTYTLPFPVSAGDIAITKTIEFLSGSNTSIFEMEYQIKLVAWAY